MKLPKLKEPGSRRVCDSILTIINCLTKWTYGIPTSESIDAKELAYKVERTLIVNYSMLKEFITNKDKLFISSF